MDRNYYFSIIWGEISSGSGDAACSFQIGSREDLVKLGADPDDDWSSYDGEEGDGESVQVWDRSNDELTCIYGRGNDLETLNTSFFSLLREHFGERLSI